MPERIYKLQPDRTLSLRGFDSFAAAASIHSASPSGFTVSGTFRDPADFCVAVLYDADNFYEHPSIKYLPDFDFSGLSLAFDLLYSDTVQPIDSPKYNWIDWATLDCIRADGNPAKLRLWDHSMLQSADFPTATGSVTVITDADGIQPYDRLSLWFQNFAYDYIVPDGHPAVEFQFFATKTGTVHSISIGGRSYSHTEINPAGESSADVAAALATAVNAGGGDLAAVASTGSTTNAVLITLRSALTGTQVAVAASDGNAAGNLFRTTPDLVAAALAKQINDTDWYGANPTHSILASASGPTLTFTAGRFGIVAVAGTAVTWTSGARFSGIVPGSVILLAGSASQVASVQSPTLLILSAPAPTGTNISYVAPRGGRDGNLITMFAHNKTSTLAASQSVIAMAGGRSDVTWRCTIDFTANQIDQIRQCWLTFAPSLTNGASYTSSEWQAVFSNWQLSGDEDKKKLQVAGPGSIRIEETDTACGYSGTSWASESGFYSQYFAKACRTVGDAVTVTYSCPSTHSLYLGTSLYSDRATAAVQVDGDAETDVVCQLNTGSAVVTRRLMRTNVAPGRHTVNIRQKTAGVLYFDFLEAAVVTDIPPALTPRNYISPALDFDTDHTYKLSPARLHWVFDQLGFAGPMNEYLGVFWWNERKLAGGSYSTGQVQFTGTWAEGDMIFLSVNGTTLGKAVFATDNSVTIASHFAAYINEAFVGAWASATSNLLTIYGRSPAPAYNLALSVTATSSAGQASVTQTPTAGEYGSWVVDDSVHPPLNRAARDWHSDFYALCAARGREVTTACSMELVLPPDGYVARYPDAARTAVSTSTGFGTLNSNHCAVGGSKMLAYQKAAYRGIAQLQAAAGLRPAVQFGEFLWWFFSGPGGMAFYDDETITAAGTALGRPLHVFLTPDDDPSVNGGADATFLRNRLRDHVAALVADLRSLYSNVRCEVLWPDDVNHQTPVPVNAPYLGGRLNHFVNLPAEWAQKGTSGLDGIKVEALAFGATMRDLNLARDAISLFPGFGWPIDSVRYLVPVFGIATPWSTEVALARAAGLQAVNLWAFDHICLYNLDVPEKSLDRRSVILTA